MTRAGIEALVARCQEAFDQHDAVALADEHSATCVMDSLTAGAEVKGREAVANIYKAWFQGFPDLVVAPEELLVDGAWFARRYTLTGTDTGGFLGLPATGKPFRLQMVWVCETRDGQIVHSRPVYDFSGLLIQIGALKAKLA